MLQNTVLHNLFRIDEQPWPPRDTSNSSLIVTNTFLQHTGIYLPYYSSKPSPSCLAPLPVAITLRLHLHLYYLIISFSNSLYGTMYSTLAALD